MFSPLAGFAAALRGRGVQNIEMRSHPFVLPAADVVVIHVERQRIWLRGRETAIGGAFEDRPSLLK